MDIETPQPILLKHPLAGVAVIRAGLWSLTKRKAPHILPDLPPLLQTGQVLEPRRIHAYAKLCGYTSPQGVPLTYPHLLAFPLHMALMLQPKFPYPVIGLVHLANRITQHRRLDSGDRLDVRVQLAEWIAHEKGQAFTLETQITRAGLLVWESTSTYLRRDVKSPQGDMYEAAPPANDPTGVLRRWTIKPGTGKNYAAISGDANPIHTSMIGARLLGFGRPIAHGMWSKAAALAALLPQHPIAQAGADIAFKTPAYIGSGVTLLTARNGNVTSFELRDGRAQKPHLRGTLTL